MLLNVKIVFDNIHNYKISCLTINLVLPLLLPTEFKIHLVSLNTKS